MTNLTLSIDEDVLQRARMRAIERRTTVNALVREYLENFAGENPANRAIAAFVEIADSVHAASGPDGHSWNRQDLYDR
jgi:Arc/MetJ family transcription regulator